MELLVLQQYWTMKGSPLPETNPASLHPENGWLEDESGQME